MTAPTYGSAAVALSGNFNSKSNNTFNLLGVIDNTALLALEIFLEVSAKMSTSPSGNQQIMLYATTSVDGTNYSDTPSSTTLPNAVPIGVITVPNSSAHTVPAIALSRFFGGELPPKVGIYAYTDAGVSTDSSGNTAQYRAVN